MYAAASGARRAKLPLNLLDALRAFDKDKGLKSALGRRLVWYLKLKMQDWQSAFRISRMGTDPHA